MHTCARARQWQRQCSALFFATNTKRATTATVVAPSHSPTRSSGIWGHLTRGSSRGWHYEVSEINCKGAVLSRDGTTNPNRTQRKAIQPPFGCLCASLVRQALRDVTKRHTAPAAEAQQNSARAHDRHRRPPLFLPRFLLAS